MKWTGIIVGALLAAGCSFKAYQPPNPCAPLAAQQSPGGGWSANFPTPHMIALGTSAGSRVVCE